MKLNIKRAYSKKTTSAEIIENLLKDREIVDLDGFLKPAHPTKIEPDFLKKDWKSAVELLHDLHKSRKSIVVYSDYDADGITGGAIMWEALYKLGFNVVPYIPLRQGGYGFSKAGIDHVIKQHNPTLIISVDHGIVAEDEIKYAKKRGVKVIVTDHHNDQGSPLTSAQAIFHTTDLSGSGVAYFFIKALAEEFGQNIAALEIKKLLRSDYLVFSAIGTIADMVPLTETNRSIAKYGLEALSKTDRIGLKLLMQKASIYGKEMTTYHVGFVIGPRLNAFGRLGDPMDALRLLCTKSADRAKELVAKSDSLNKERQVMTKKAVSEAEKMIDPSSNVIVLSSEDWDEGIIGLIAGKILEKTYKPTIVLSLGDKVAKASVRSVKDVHITNFLKGLEDHLIDMGGHAAAAGFSIERDNLDTFQKELKKKAEAEITDEMLKRSITIDVEMPLSSATYDLAIVLGDLRPFGIGNKNPVFLSDAEIRSKSSVGKVGSHAKFVLGSGGSGGPGVASSSGTPGGSDAPGDDFLEAIYFNIDDKENFEKGTAVRALYNLEIHEWNYKTTLQAVVKSFMKL